MSIDRARKLFGPQRRERSEARAASAGVSLMLQQSTAFIGLIPDSCGFREETGVDLRKSPDGDRATFARQATNRGEKWLRGRDLNPGPQGYEPCELPDCSTPRQVKIVLPCAFHGVKVRMNSERETAQSIAHRRYHH